MDSSRVVSCFVMAGVALSVPVVVASGVGVIEKGSFHQSMGSLVCFPSDSGKKLDVGLRQCVLGPHADAATDQSVHPGLL